MDTENSNTGSQPVGGAIQAEQPQPIGGPSQAGQPQPHGGASGTIHDMIGTGQNAQLSIVWMTITWSFVIAVILTGLLFALVVCYKDFAYFDNVKDVWSIFVPIITLALGYAFGKSS
jgi:hypothetical protein